MSELIHVHAQTPQPRRIEKAAQALRDGKVISYPTDSSYGLACAMGDKAAMEHIREIRGLDHEHFFTLVCRDLSEIAKYAKVENTSYRLLKAATPGAYTFVLPASKQVPNWLAHPKRKTIGIRVPNHPVPRAIAQVLEEPFLSVTASTADDKPLSDAGDVSELYGSRIDLILDGGATGVELTTVINLTTDVPEVLRAGKGSLEAIGLNEVAQENFG